MDTTEPISDQLVHARAALASWEHCALFDLAQGLPIAAFISPDLGQDITIRIARALQSCKTVQDVKMVFASAQECQLV